jgi:hypothetical protein
VSEIPRNAALEINEGFSKINMVIDGEISCETQTLLQDLKILLEIKFLAKVVLG